MVNRTAVTPHITDMFQNAGGVPDKAGSKSADGNNAARFGDMFKNALEASDTAKNMAQPVEKAADGGETADMKQADPTESEKETDDSAETNDMAAAESATNAIIAAETGADAENTESDAAAEATTDAAPRISITIGEAVQKSAPAAAPEAPTGEPNAGSVQTQAQDKTQTQAQAADHGAVITAAETVTGNQPEASPVIAAYNEHRAASLNRLVTVPEANGETGGLGEVIQKASDTLEGIKEPKAPAANQTAAQSEPEAPKETENAVAADSKTIPQAKDAGETEIAANTSPAEKPAAAEEIKAPKAPEIPVKTEVESPEAVKTEISQIAEKDIEPADSGSESASAASRERRAEAAPETAKPVKQETKAAETPISTEVRPEANVRDIERSSEPQAPNPVRTPDQAEQIQARIIENLQNGRTEFTMKLNPRELGEIDVRMVMESGKLAVEIISADPKTTELLQRQAEALAVSLKSNGAELSAVNIVTGGENASADMNGEFNSLNRQGGERDGGEHANSSSRAGSSPEDDGEPPKSEEGTMPNGLLNYSV